MELALIVLACVIGSAGLCQVVPRLSLPLVQIAVGAVVALAVPAVRDVSISSELFLVLFIAPLLFNEARETNPRDLWENKGSVLSLAVGLVLLTVLVVGFVLNWFVPSIPLAAAFACAAALAVLQIFEQENLLEKANQLGDTLRQGLLAIAEDHQRRVRRCRLPIRQCRRPHRGFLGPRCR